MNGPWIGLVVAIGCTCGGLLAFIGQARADLRDLEDEHRRAVEAMR